MGRSKITTGSTQAQQGTPLIRRLLPGLVVSIICLAVVFYLIDLREFAAAVRQANPWVLLVGGSMTLLWLLVRARVWYTLLQQKASYHHVFLTLNEGYLLNNFLPFRLGEVGRAFLLGRKANLGFWQVVPSILVERTLDLALAVGLFLSTFPFVVGVDWARQAAIGMGLVVACGLMGLYLLARNRQRVLRWLERAAQHWALFQRLAGRRMESFFAGLAILTDHRLFLHAVGWMVLNWLLGIAQYYLLLLAFFPQSKPLWAAFCLGSASLGIAAPSSPGALGVYEAVVVGALAVFGLNPSTAAAFALAAHSFNYLITGALGGYALALDGESISGLYRKLGKISEG